MAADISQLLADAKQAGEAARAAIPSSSLIVDESGAPVRVNGPVATAANATPYEEKLKLVQSEASHVASPKGTLGIENTEASRSLARAQAEGVMERAANPDSLLKAHLEGTADAIKGDKLLHASEVGKANQAAQQAASADGRLAAAHEEGVIQRAANPHVSDPVAQQIEAAKTAGNMERANTRFTAAQEVSANDRLENAHNAGTAERQAAANEAQSRIEAAAKEGHANSLQGKLEAAAKEGHAAQAAEHAHSPQGRIEAAAKEGHATQAAEHANSSQGKLEVAAKEGRAAQAVEHTNSPQGKIEAAAKEGHATQAAEHAKSPQGKIEAAAAEGHASHGTAASRAAAQHEALEKLSPDERLKIAHSQGVARNAEKYVESANGRLEAAHKAGVEERAVLKAPAPKSVAQLTAEAANAAKEEVAHKAAAEGAQLAKETVIGAKDVAAKAATHGAKEAVEVVMKQGAKITLGTVARGAGAAAIVALAGKDVVEGIVEHDDRKTGRGVVKGVFGTVGGAIGFVAGSGLPVVGNIALGVAGAAVGEKFGDAMTDAMTGSGGLTDRSGKPVHYASSTNMHGGKVTTPPVAAKAEPHVETPSGGLTDRSGNPITYASAPNMHGGTNQPAVKATIPVSAVAAPVVEAPAPAKSVVPAHVVATTAAGASMEAVPAAKDHAHTAPKAHTQAATAHASKPAAAAGDKSPNALARQLAEDMKIHMQAHTKDDDRNAAIKGTLAQIPNVSIDDIRAAYGMSTKSEDHAKHVAQTDALPVPLRIISPEVALSGKER